MPKSEARQLYGCYPLESVNISHCKVAQSAASTANFTSDDGNKRHIEK